jgi:hypothetical protein
MEPLVSARVSLWASAALLAAVPDAALSQVSDEQPVASGASEPAPDASVPSEKPLADLLNSAIEPENPAFALLGVSASDIVRPQSLQSLALGLLNGLDQRGNFQSGVAMEFSPTSLLFGKQLTLRNYQKHYYGLLGQLARTRTSIAIANGSAKDKAARASFGLTWTPFDGSDHNAPGAGSTCVDDAGPHPVFIPGDAVATAANRKLAEEAIQACMSQFLRPDQSFGLQFGFAALFVSESGATDDFKAKGYTATGTASIGLTRLLYGSSPASTSASADPRRAMLILTGTYRKHELIPDPVVDKAFLQRDRWTLGGRFEIGKQDRFMLGLESVFQHADYAARTSDRYVTLVGTLDIKVRDTLWLGLNLGTSSGRSIEGDEQFIGTRIRWALNSKSTGGLF